MTSLRLLVFLLATARPAPVPSQDSLIPSTAVDSPLKAIQENSYMNKFMLSLKNLLNHINQRIPDNHLENIKCDLIVSKNNESDGFIFKYLRGKLYPSRIPVYSDKTGKNVGPKKYMEIHFIDNSDSNNGNQLVIKLPDPLSPDSTQTNKYISSILQSNENISGNNLNKSKGVDEANNATTDSSERYTFFTEEPVLLHSVASGVHVHEANNHSRDKDINEKGFQDYSTDSILFEATAPSSLTNTVFLNASYDQESEISSETYTSAVTLQLNNSLITNSTTSYNLPTKADKYLNTNKTSYYSQSLMKPLPTYSDTETTIKSILTSDRVSEMQTTRSEGSTESLVFSEGFMNLTTNANRSETEFTINYPIVNDYKQDDMSETTKSDNGELEYTKHIGKTANITTESESTSDLPSSLSNFDEEDLLNKSTKIFITETEHTPGLPLSSFNNDNKDINYFFNQNETTKSLDTESENIPSITSSTFKNDNQDQQTTVTKLFNAESNYTPGLLSSSISNDNQDQNSEATKSFNIESEYTPGLTPSLEKNNNQGQHSETTKIFNTQSHKTLGLSTSSLNNNQDQNETTYSFNTESGNAPEFSTASSNNVHQDQTRETTRSFNIESEDTPGVTSSSLNYDNQDQLTKANKSLNTEAEYTQGLSLASLNNNNQDHLSEATKSINIELDYTPGLSLLPESNDNQDQQSEGTKLFNTPSDDTSGLTLSSFNNNNQDLLTKVTKSFNTESEYTQGFSSSYVSNDNQDHLSESTKSFNTESEQTPGISSSSLDKDDNQDELTKPTTSFNTEPEYIQGLPSLSSNNADHRNEVTKSFNTESGYTTDLASSMNDYNQDQLIEYTKSFNTEFADSSHFPTSSSIQEKQYTYIEMTTSRNIENVSSTSLPSYVIHNQDHFNRTTLQSETVGITDPPTTTVKKDTTQLTNLTPSINHDEYDQPNESPKPSNMNTFASTNEIHLFTNYNKSSEATKFSTPENPAITTVSTFIKNTIEDATEISIMETYTKDGTNLALSSLNSKQIDLLSTNTTPSPEENSDILETATEVKLKRTTISYDVINNLEPQTEMSSNTGTTNLLSKNKKEDIESTEKIDPTSKLEAVTVNSFEITTENAHNLNTLIHPTNVAGSDGKIPVFSQRLNHSKSLKTPKNLTIPSRDNYNEEYTTKNYTLLGPMVMSHKKKNTSPTLDGYGKITTISSYEPSSKDPESSSINELTTHKSVEYKPTVSPSENILTDISEYTTSNKLTMTNMEHSKHFYTTLDSLSKLPEDSDIEENGHKPSYFNNNQTETFDGLGNHTASTDRPHQYDTISTTSILIHSFIQDNSLNQTLENNGFTQTISIHATDREGKLLEMELTTEAFSTKGITTSEFLVTSGKTSGSVGKETYEILSSSITTPMGVTNTTTFHQYSSNTQSKNITNSENFESTTEGLASKIPNFDEETSVKYTTNQPSTLEIANSNLHLTNTAIISKPTRGPRLLPTKQENIELSSFNTTISSISNIYQSRTTLDPNQHNYTKILNSNINLPSPDYTDLSHNNNNEPNKESPQNIVSTTPQYSTESDFNNFTFYIPTTEHLTLYVPAKISFRAMTKYI